MQEVGQSHQVKIFLKLKSKKDNNITCERGILTRLQGNYVNPILARSVKKCDNLLVKTDIFCHFRGIILCNAKRFQFDKKNKKKNIRAQFIKFSFTFCHPFKKNYGGVPSVLITQKFSSLRRLDFSF